MLKIAKVLSKEKKQEVLEYLGSSVIDYSKNARIIICDVNEDQQNYLESNNLAKLYSTEQPNNTQLMLCNKLGMFLEDEHNHDPCNVPDIDSFYNAQNNFNVLTDPTNFKNLSATINLNYTGKNVDVVIVDDSPCPPDHPEFLSNDDNTGKSRVHNIDWNRTLKYKSSFNTQPFEYRHPIAATETLNDFRHNRPYYFYDNSATKPSPFRDFMRWGAAKYDTHGVHVAGTACGNTQGWAKKSSVYFMEYTNISYVYPGIWLTGEHLLNFHLNKPINPHTGRKNPTVANMSFGKFYRGALAFIIETINHRGQTYSIPTLYNNVTTSITANSSIITLPSTEGIEVGYSIFKLSGTGQLYQAPNNAEVTDDEGGPNPINYFGNANKFGIQSEDNEALVVRIISSTEIEVSGKHQLSGDITLKVVGWPYAQLIYQFGFLMKLLSFNFSSLGESIPMPVIASYGIEDPLFATYIEDAIDAGVTIVAAGGNTSMKVDVPGGLDWNNHWIGRNNTYQNYYHRGSWPANVSGVISVGSMSANVQENKSYFSVSGPGVDIYAPGEGIQSSIKESFVPTIGPSKSWNSVPELRNSKHFLGRVWGTSMASPQVAGMVACYLEKEPDSTPTQVKQWLIDNGKSVIYNSNGGYGDLYDLQGGTNKLAYFPYGSYTINSNTISYPSITSNPVPNNIANFDCGFAHCLLLTTNGDLYSWGHNNQGQLGNGSLGNSSIPTKIGENYTQISAGLNHSLGLKSNGDLYAWGWNYYGQLGISTNTVKNNSTVPILVGQDYIYVSAGEDISFGIKSNGDLYAWGYNNGFTLGDGNTAHTSVPIKIGEGYSKVVAGKTDMGILLSGGLKSNGDFYVWGKHNQDNTELITIATPTKKGEGYQDIDTGGCNVILLKSNGDVYGFGRNVWREFGTETAYISDSPLLINNNCASINAAYRRSYVIKTNGDLYSAGLGILGDGLDRSTLGTQANSFVKIGNNTYSSIKAGQYHTLAIDTNADLYVWGINTVGQLAINLNFETILSPLQLT